MIEPNNIYFGDCLDIMQDIPDGSVNLIMTDPPYIVSKSRGGGSVNNIKKLNVSLEDLDDAKLRDGYDIKRISNDVQRLQGGRINAYFWCSKAQIADYFKVYVEGLKCKFDIITWHKQNALPTYFNKYLSDTEYCLYFHHGGFTHPACYDDAKTYEIGYINHADKKMYGHPTIKPCSITQRMIRNSSKVGDVVLDMFMGSGTTCVAAIKENRKYIGIEKDPHYFDIAKKRIEQEKMQLTLF